MTNPTSSRVAYTIEPATNDAHDRSYRFGKPLTYLSEREQARLLIVRGRLHDSTADADGQAA